MKPFLTKSYMEQKPITEQTTEDERYKAFAEDQRKLAAGIGERVSDVAKERKESKERDAESACQAVEEYGGKVERLREDVDAKKKSLLSKVINFKKLKELQKELHRSENILSEREAEQKWHEEMIGYYDRILEEEEAMGRLMEEAYVDNALFDEKKRVELAEEEKGRSVAEQAKKHGVFFVSDIVTADWKPSANNYAIDTRQLDFDDQLNIILGLEPTLSVSTLSLNSQNRTFGTGAWGVLLSGGRIIGGEETDAATVATGLRNRHIQKESRSIAAIDKAIERPWSGGKEGSTSYNELVVEQPEVAGVYFKIESSDIPHGMQEGMEIWLPEQYGDAWWEQIGSIMKTGAPLFAIEQNSIAVRMVYDINLKDRTFKVTPSYAPENMTDMPGIYKQHIDEGHRRDAIGKVLDKVAHLLSEEDRALHEQEKNKKAGDNFINVY